MRSYHCSYSPSVVLYLIMYAFEKDESRYRGKHICFPDDNVLLVVLASEFCTAVPAVQHCVALIQVGLHNLALIVLLSTAHCNDLSMHSTSYTQTPSCRQLL